MVVVVEYRCVVEEKTVVVVVGVIVELPATFDQISKSAPSQKVGK